MPKLISIFEDAMYCGVGVDYTKLMIFKKKSPSKAILESLKIAEAIAWFSNGEYYSHGSPTDLSTVMKLLTMEHVVTKIDQVRIHHLEMPNGSVRELTEVEPGIFDSKDSSYDEHVNLFSRYLAYDSFPNSTFEC